MNSLKALCTATAMFFFVAPVMGQEQELFYAPGCHPQKAETAQIELDTDFVTVEGSDYSPRSCKGNLCWTWKVEKNPEKQALMIVFSSDIGVRISEARKRSVVQAIKNSVVKNENTGILTDRAVAEAITRGHETEKAKSSSSEFAYEWNINALFHSFLAKAIAPVRRIESYPFCISGAVDLYFQVLQAGKVEKLIEAFILYRSFTFEKIEKMRISRQERTAFDRAVRLYRELLRDIDGEREVDKITKDRLWAKACLFSYFF